MEQRCSLCQTDSPRMNSRLLCCKVRFISKLPKAQRQEAYARAREEQGEEAAKVLIEAVNAEYQRRMSLKPEAAPGVAQ